MIKKSLILWCIIFCTISSLIKTNSENQTIKHFLKITVNNDPFALSKVEADIFADRLIAEPLKLLNELKDIQHIFCEINNISLSFTQKKALFKKYRDKNPIFLLSECDAGTCGLSRYQNSNRSHYEDVCIKYLKKHKNQNKVNLGRLKSRRLQAELRRF